jgi:hypothetical protein
VSGRLSSLELRLERCKRISNLRLDFLKRLNDGGSISELYASGKMNFHVHVAASDGMWCLNYRSLSNITKISGRFSGVGVYTDGSADWCKLSMFVWVGDDAESLSPIASAVGLKPLDCCEMSGLEKIPAGFLPTSEFIFRAYNGKLRELLLDSGVQFDKFENEVIESGAQIIANFSDKNTKTRACECFSREKWLRIMRGTRVELHRHGFFLKPEDGREPLLKVRQMFLCPSYSFEHAVEYVRDHATIPA